MRVKSLVALLRRLLSRADRQALRTGSEEAAHAPTPPSLAWAIRREMMGCRLRGGGGDDEDDQEEREALRSILRSQHQLAQKLAAQQQREQRERTDRLEQQVAALRRRPDRSGESEELAEELASQRRSLEELRQLEEEQARKLSEMAEDMRRRAAEPVVPAGDLPVQEIIERSAAMASQAAVQSATEAAALAAESESRRGLAAISSELAQATEAAGAAAEAAQQAAQVSTQVSGETIRKVQCEKVMCDQAIHSRKDLRKKFTTLHPDMGGDVEVWHRIQDCYNKIDDSKSIYCTSDKPSTDATPRHTTTPTRRSSRLSTPPSVDDDTEAVAEEMAAAEAAAEEMAAAEAAAEARAAPPAAEAAAEARAAPPASGASAVAEEIAEEVGQSCQEQCRSSWSRLKVWESEEQCLESCNIQNLRKKTEQQTEQVQHLQAHAQVMQDEASEAEEKARQTEEQLPTNIEDCRRQCDQKGLLGQMKKFGRSVGVGETPEECRQRCERDLHQNASATKEHAEEKAQQARQAETEARQAEETEEALQEVADEASPERRREREADDKAAAAAAAAAVADQSRQQAASELQQAADRSAGMSLSQVVAEVERLVEQIASADIRVSLGEKHGLSLTATDNIYDTMFRVESGPVRLSDVEIEGAEHQIVEHEVLLKTLNRYKRRGQNIKQEQDPDSYFAEIRTVREEQERSRRKLTSGEDPVRQLQIFFQTTPSLEVMHQLYQLEPLRLKYASASASKLKNRRSTGPIATISTAGRTGCSPGYLCRPCVCSAALRARKICVSSGAAASRSTCSTSCTN